MPKYTEEEKQKALALAEATSFGAASEKLGIPKTTIWRWYQKQNGTYDETERNVTPKKAKEIAKEATKEAKEEVKQYIVEQSKKVADDILSMVKKAVIEAGHIIDHGPNKNEKMSEWLRAVIGAMAQGVEKHQLLTGKPTSRQALEGQVNYTNEQRYHIIQEIVNTPEFAKRIKDNFRSRIRDSASKE